MQCQNCQRYGHGNANCHRPPVCVKCAGSHASKSCPLSVTTTSPAGKIAPTKLRCANCGDHHTANYSGCPTRVSVTKATKAPPKTKEFKYNETSFPSIGNPPKPSQVPINYSNVFNSKKKASTGDFVINFEEICQIVEDVFTHLSECRNKKDLISVIVQITAKYCFSNGK